MGAALATPAPDCSPPVKSHKQHHDDPAHKKGLRTVATIEFTKGIIAIAVGFGLLALVHKDLWDISLSLLERFHLNPDRHWAQAFLDLADRITDGQLYGLAGFLFVYSILRFIEAYGLWKTRVWAEWLAILSGMVYLPLEIHEIIRKPNLLHWTALILNLALVLYVAYVRYSGHQRERLARVSN